MFIINIIKAIRSITSIYIIRFDSDIYINIIFGFNTDLGFNSDNTVAGKV